MAEPPGLFADVLRGLRAAAGLTQEELAGATGLSPRAISNLERGLVTIPHKDTVRLLAEALHLDGSARAEFEAAARDHAGHGRAGTSGWQRRRGRCPAISPRSRGGGRSWPNWRMRRRGRAGW